MADNVKSARRAESGKFQKAKHFIDVGETSWHSRDKNEMKNTFHLASSCEVVKINFARVQ